MPIEIPTLSNCLQNGAFIKLEDNASGTKAPILRYSIPQKSEFSAYGHVKLPLSFEKFKGYDPPFVLTPTANELAQDVLFPGHSYFVQNPHLLQTSQTIPVLNADFVPTQFAAALATNISAINTSYVTAGIQLATDNNNTSSLRTTGNVDGSEFDTGTPVPDPTSVAYASYLQKMATLLQTNALVYTQGMGRFNSQIRVLPRPFTSIEAGRRLTVRPTLFIVEEYKIASYLGDYGAGKTVNTFTLLPGEKTTITVKTFKELNSTKSSSENVVDSFSEASANEMENLLQEEANMQTTDTTTTESASQKNKASQAGASVSASGGFFGINASASANYSQSAASAASKSQSVSTGRNTNVKNLSNAMAKHVENSNSSRNVAINTTTQDSYTESTETSVVRELVNPNQSRVLNFVFRQLLQEYITITYLSDVKVAYSNGHPESFRIVSLSELDLLLEDVMTDDNAITAVKKMIDCAYGAGSMVRYADGTLVPFLDEVTQKNFGCEDVIRFVKSQEAVDSYTPPDGGLTITVPGIILNVDKHVLRTDSVIADALLGQGDALDCFNGHVQEAKKNQIWLENAKTQFALETLALIPDPIARAEWFAKFFNPPPVTTETPTP